VRKDCYLFDVSEARIERIQIKIETENALGITIHCKKDLYVSSFRCIIPSESVLREICRALKETSHKNVKNVDDFLRDFEAHNPFRETGDPLFTPRKGGLVKLLNEAETRSINASTKST
jgi:hypothetical protein